eukprot:jgi/Mesen1/3002/ME000177S02269
MSLTKPAKRSGSGSSLNTQPNGLQINGAGKLEPGVFHWNRYFDKEHEWDRDELGDVLHWMRQVVGFLAGLVYGVVPVTGGIGLAVFLVLSSALVAGYYAGILKLDADDFGGHLALLQEGFMASIGLFLLTWILVYSCVHF